MPVKKDFSYTDESGIGNFLKGTEKRKPARLKRGNIKKPFEALPALPPWNPKKNAPIGKDLFNALEELYTEKGDVPRTKDMHSTVDKIKGVFHRLRKIYQR